MVLNCNMEYYIYNFKQAKFIIKETQDFSFIVGVGAKGDIYFKFNDSPTFREAMTKWKNNK